MNHLPSDAEVIVNELVLGPTLIFGGLVAAATALLAIGLTGNRPGAVAWTPPPGRRQWQRPQANWQRTTPPISPPARVNADTSCKYHTFIGDYIIRK